MGTHRDLKLLYLVICDSFSTEPTTGKRSFQGLFDKIMVNKLPSSHSMLTVAFGLEGGEGTCQIWTKLINPDGKEILGSPIIPVTPKDPYRREDMILQLNGLKFETLGRYEVRVVSGEKEQRVLGSHPIYIEQIQSSDAIKSREK